jgi:hypothetical protein
MWQGLLCGICMHPCALPGCELRFVMVTRWHFTGYPVTKLERFRMQRLFFLIHGGCLDVLLVFCAH